MEWPEKIIIGIGEEWKKGPDAGSEKRLREAYEALYQQVQGKDYWVSTTVTDGLIYETAFDPKRITAPCGNDHWFQCSKACTKDIWEEGEVPEGICPHCGAPLTANTVQADPYIEEGYLPQWEAYKKWQATILNRDLLLLELGSRAGLSYGNPLAFRTDCHAQQKGQAASGPRNLEPASGRAGAGTADQGKFGGLGFGYIERNFRK